MKYLLLLTAVLLCCFLVRASLRRKREERSRKADVAKPEDMVRCVQCGIHLPRGESLMVRGQTFCCAEHQQRQQNQQNNSDGSER